MMRRLFLFMALLAPGLSFGAERLKLVWPAPHPAWSQGKSSDAFLQEAGSGDPASGGFGGVRSRDRGNGGGVGGNGGNDSSAVVSQIMSLPTCKERLKKLEEVKAQIDTAQYERLKPFITRRAQEEK